MATAKMADDDNKTPTAQSLRKNSDSDSVFSSSSNIGVVAKALGAKYGKKRPARPLTSAPTNSLPKSSAKGILSDSDAQGDGANILDKLSNAPHRQKEPLKVSTTFSQESTEKDENMARRTSKQAGIYQLSRNPTTTSIERALDEGVEFYYTQPRNASPHINCLNSSKPNELPSSATAKLAHDSNGEAHPAENQLGRHYTAMLKTGVPETSGSNELPLPPPPNLQHSSYGASSEPASEQPPQKLEVKPGSLLSSKREPDPTSMGNPTKIPTLSKAMDEGADGHNPMADEKQKKVQVYADPGSPKKGSKQETREKVLASRKVEHNIISSRTPTLLRKSTNGSRHMHQPVHDTIKQTKRGEPGLNGAGANTEARALKDTDTVFHDGTRCFEIFEKDEQGNLITTAGNEQNASKTLPCGRIPGNTVENGVQRLAPQCDSQSKAVHRIGRGAARMVEMEAARKATDLARLQESQNRKASLLSVGEERDPSGKAAKKTHAEGPSTLTKTEKLCKLTPSSNKAKSALTLNSLQTHPQGKRVKRRELSKASDKDTNSRLLAQIKKWSVPYLQKKHSEINDAEIWSPQDESDLASDLSEADTRSLSGVSSLPEVHSDEADAGLLSDWLEFIGQGRHQRKCDKRSYLEVAMQLSEWDGEFQIPDRGLLESARWSRHHGLANRVDKWIEMNVDIHHRYVMDMKSPEFELGRSHPSGLLQDRVPQPPDALFDSSDPEFGPIDWESIPGLPPKNAAVLSPFQHRQTAEMCIEIAQTPYREKAGAVEMDQVEMQKQGKRLADEAVAKKKASAAKEELRENTQWIPRMNCYIRPARQHDTMQITQIYNLWLQSSVSTKDLTPRDDSFFEELISKQHDVGLPFLVAGTRSARNIRSKRDGKLVKNVRIDRLPRDDEKDEHLNRHEQIVGFTYNEPWNPLSGDVFRGVMELKLFTDPKYLHRGVGKTLLDRMMAFIDPLYKHHNGTQFESSECSDGITYKLGAYAPKNKTRKLIIDVLYETVNADEFAWKKEMLEQKFGFHQTSLYLSLADKDGRPVNMATFMREACNAEGVNSMIYPGEPKEIRDVFFGYNR